MNSTQIVPRLQFVADEEKVNMTEDGKKALITLAQGDMRKVRMIMIRILFGPLFFIELFS